MELQNPEKPESGKSNTPYGVHGFLLFICISLVFIIPALTAIGFYRIATRPAKIDWSPNNVIIFCQNILMTAVPLLAGILLWMKKRTGLLLVRIFYVCQLALNLFNLGIDIFLNSITQKYSPERIAFIVIEFSLTTVIGLLYLYYFFKSKRVKNTYPRKIPETAA
jgi:hypothetical protein